MCFMILSLSLFVLSLSDTLSNASRGFWLALNDVKCCNPHHQLVISGRTVVFSVGSCDVFGWICEVEIRYPHPRQSAGCTVKCCDAVKVWSQSSWLSCRIFLEWLYEIVFLNDLRFFWRRSNKICERIQLPTPNWRGLNTAKRNKENLERTRLSHRTREGELQSVWYHSREVCVIYIGVNILITNYKLDFTWFLHLN